MDRLGLIGGLPFPINRGKSAGIDDLLGRLLDDFEVILSQVGAVDGAGRVSRPGKRLDDDPIETEQFVGRVPGMIVVDPHCPRNGEDFDCHNG